MEVLSLNPNESFLLANPIGIEVRSGPLRIVSKLGCSLAGDDASSDGRQEQGFARLAHGSEPHSSGQVVEDDDEKQILTPDQLRLQRFVLTTCRIGPTPAPDQFDIPSSVGGFLDQRRIYTD